MRLRRELDTRLPVGHSQLCDPLCNRRPTLCSVIAVLWDYSTVFILVQARFLQFKLHKRLAEGNLSRKPEARTHVNMLRCGVPRHDGKLNLCRAKFFQLI